MRGSAIESVLNTNEPLHCQMRAFKECKFRIDYLMQMGEHDRSADQN